MNFLKEILGDELYSQIESKINEYNGNEANKDKQVKIGNLGTGEYVGKGKFDALQELVNSKETELKSANDLIAELKKGFMKFGSPPRTDVMEHPSIPGKVLNSLKPGLIMKCLNSGQWKMDMKMICH